MEFDQFLFDEFVAEANEHLATIEDDFLALESQQETPDQELMDKLFRAIHSIKGGSGFLGLERINGLSHGMESLLSKLRSRELKPESRSIDALLAGVDLLRNMIAAPLASNTTDIADIERRLAECVGKHAAPALRPTARASSERRPPQASVVFPSSEAASKEKSPTEPPQFAPLLVSAAKTTMVVDQELVGEFIAEANEHLSSIVEDFLALEAQGAHPNQDLVDKIFRAIHSIKGGSGFVGFQRISYLSHAMESLMSKVRTGEIQPRAEHIDALLRGVDLLSAMIAAPMQSEGVAIEVVQELLLDLVAGAIDLSKRVAPAATATIDAVSGRVALEDAVAATALARYDYIYRLEFNLTDLSRAKGQTPAELFLELGQNGEILAAELLLDVSEPPPATLRCEALYATLLDPDIVGVVVDLPEDQVTLLRELHKIALPPPESPAVLLVEEHAEPFGSDIPPHTTRAVSSAKAPSAPSPASAAVEKAGTIRIHVGILDKLMTLAGELVLVRNQQLLSMDRLDAGHRDIVQRLDMVTSELQETIMRTRMQPIGNVFGKLPRIVRDLTSRLAKQISIDIAGNEVELDKTILESLNDPLTHIIRNCCDHGVELPEVRKRAGKSPTGTIRVRAFHEGGQINIEIKDDGKGIDPEVIRGKILERGLRSEVEVSQMSDKEVLQLIHLPGFSTAEKVSDVSGRGVGMDVVKHAIEELGGSIELESWVGEGTSIQLRLPLTLAIIPCLIVMVGRNRYAVPQVNLVELVRLYDDDVATKIEVAGNQEVYRLRDRLLPMVRLNEVLRRPKPFTRSAKARIAEENRSNEAAQRAATSEEFGGKTLNFAVVKVGADRFGLIVDSILSTEEIVVKPMHSSLKPLRCYSGATVMGDGAVALILDIEGIARHAGVFLEPHGEVSDGLSAPGTSHWDTQSILLFRIGGAERFALALPLIRRIEKISMSRVERIGKKEFITIEGGSTLVLRLDQFLPVASCSEKQDMFLILPKFIVRPFGILMSEIVDIVETPVNLNTESYMEDGLLGTDIIAEHLTLFPDIYRLIELAEPQWFAERRRNLPLQREKKRVLVVEDSAFFRQMVTKYLEADNYEPIAVEHGRAALDMLHEREFDLIVSDIEMPVMNGFEFVKNLRHSAFKDIPAMALTSLKTEEDRLKALECGFDAYQVKIDREQFLSEAARLLRKKPAPSVAGAA